MAHLNNRNVHEKYDADEMQSIRLSVIPLTSVAIASRGDISPVSLSTMNAIEALNSNFNVGTEKAKANTTYN